MTVRWFSLIDIKHNFTDCIDDLQSIVKDQIPFATSLAMNNSLKSVREKVKAEMDNHIEGGPTYFTRTGMMLFATSKDNFEGALVFKSLDGSQKKSRGYMRQLMYSGKKDAFRRKLPEPDVDNFRKYAPTHFTDKGNIKRNFYKIATAKGSKKYFKGIPKPGKPHWKNNEALRGIWVRTEDGPRMLVSLKRSSRQQRKTFDAPFIARQHYNSIIHNEYRDAFVFALKTMKF
jgi:hypothetical protein